MRITQETLLVMNQNLGQNFLNESKANEKVPKRGTNKGEKYHKCNQCDYAGKYAGTLKRHLRTHSGEKPNKCNQCEFASSQAGHLRTHLKTHTGEKPNRCNQCDFTCIQGNDLKVHMLKHRGENRISAVNATLHPCGKSP